MKSPVQIVTSYYEFFTEPQWSTLNQYVNRTVKDREISTLLEKLSQLGMPPGKTLKDATASDLDHIRDLMEKVSHAQHSTKILGTNVSKMFIDAYTPD